MNPAQMRKAISDKYGPSMVLKVERMPDYQVAAMYQRMLSAGKFKE